jgi:hypothetical protein
MGKPIDEAEWDMVGGCVTLGSQSIACSKAAATWKNCDVVFRVILSNEP